MAISALLCTHSHWNDRYHRSHLPEKLLDLLSRPSFWDDDKKLQQDHLGIFDEEKKLQNL